jgi:hypothetical protein
MTNRVQIRPGSAQCVGRDRICTDLVDATRRTNAVLLFGGRQAGKTTILLKVRDRLSEMVGNVSKVGYLDVPVYVDLTRLPYDATPAAFFDLLSRKAAESCRSQISGFSVRDTQSTSQSADLLEEFIGSLRSIQQCCGEVEVRFVFLLDEAKRILGDRFPRGFQDNLFSLLFGEFAGTDYSASMVFAGGQHLYAFSEDDTSPIGSRARSLFVSNLTLTAIKDLAALVWPDLCEETCAKVAEYICERTGGQAGLVARFIEELSGADGPANVINMLESAENSVLNSNKGLFENWTLSLTEECQVVVAALMHRGAMQLTEVSTVLHDHGFSRFTAPRVTEELQYMGIAVAKERLLEPANEIFSTYWKSLDVPIVESSSASTVWGSIEEAELSLRQLISRKLSEAFGSQSEKIVSEILGAKAWADIQDTMQKSAAKYRRSRERVERDVYSCMYFGHLKTLIVSGRTWHLYKHMFRDKRELEDMTNAIMPVRNDRAHFSTVPSKELERCRIACDDLLVISERELDAMGDAG